MKTITEKLEEEIPPGDSCFGCPYLSADFHCNLMEEDNPLLQKHCGINE